jgi:signal transduction histidine kinase
VSALSVEDLRTVPAFAELTDDQLSWLAAHGELLECESGEQVFEFGAPAEHMVAVLDGAIEILFSVGGQLVPYFTQRQGTLTGLLPFSRMRSYGGSGRALGRTRLYRLHQAHFDEMLRVAPPLGPRVVSIMTDRVRDTTRFTQQREKMMALGKLSAGLAHELNNPAAAARRNADALAEQLARLPDLTHALVADAIEADAFARVGRLLASLAQGASADRDMSARERSRLEEEVGSWLDERSVPESWTLVEPFVDSGLRPEHLRMMTENVPPAAVAGLMNWLGAVLETQRLSHDIRAAAGRISELVGSVKVYSHMDRADDREHVDLREGLDATLVMLGHKLKRKNITLERAYSPDVPPVEGFPGELNQVWTNLADNAIDAMPEHGVLRVETEREGGTAVIRVIDNGAGIPPEIQSRIFEAFFTTKPMGEGTGLGLDIVQRIVAQQHGGRIEVDSRPGRTVFTVRLPIDFTA